VDLYRWVRAQWDRALAIVATIVGLVLLIVGYLGVSDATLPTEQIPYLASNGLFGIFALGVGATLWLSADLRDEWRKLDDIHRDLRQEREERAGVDESAQPLTASGGAPRRTRRAG
jgi:hypothetical protein